MGQKIKSIRHRFPLDINCGSPPNRRTTDTVGFDEKCWLLVATKCFRFVYGNKSITSVTQKVMF